MLLIRCPYCEEERPELEFRNAGEAHIARSADLAGESRRGFREVPLHPLQSQGAASSSAGGTSMAARRFFNAVRDTVTDKFVVDLQGRRAEARLIRRPSAAAMPSRRRRSSARAKQGDAR